MPTKSGEDNKILFLASLSLIKPKNIKPIVGKCIKFSSWEITENNGQEDRETIELTANLLRK